MPNIKYLTEDQGSDPTLAEALKEIAEEIAGFWAYVLQILGEAPKIVAYILGTLILLATSPLWVGPYLYHRKQHSNREA
jgi:hypothetical protein